MEAKARALKRENLERFFLEQFQSAKRSKVCLTEANQEANLLPIQPSHIISME